MASINMRPCSVCAPTTLTWKFSCCLPPWCLCPYHTIPYSCTRCLGILFLPFYTTLQPLCGDYFFQRNSFYLSYLIKSIIISQHNCRGLRTIINSHFYRLGRMCFSVCVCVCLIWVRMLCRTWAQCVQANFRSPSLPQCLIQGEL